MRRLAALVVGFAALVGGARAAERSPEAAATIVVYNRGDAASRALAEYYAGRRNIPPEQVVGIPCSNEEEISRDEYEITIASPLRAAFTKFGWWSIGSDGAGRRQVTEAGKRFVALMRGVPLKIRPDPNLRDPAEATAPSGSALATIRSHNEASVDSELSAFFALDHQTIALLLNPYYRRLASIFQVAPAESPLLVCRLDGPSDEVVRRMIDDSLAAEKGGLWGWAYLDARNIQSGTYLTGDEWIIAAGKAMSRQGVPVISDYAPETLPPGYPVTDAAIYYGWYTSEVSGPFAADNFRFVPGAIAVHLHSFSARTLRSAKAAWAAPLLADGAAATMGNVYEPYLEFTINFDILQDRLMNGLTLAESAYAATRALSWMGVVVGDPLYRPYASWLDLEADGSSIWPRYRKVVLAAGGDVVAAAGPLRKLAESTRNSMPLEALAQAQAGALRYIVAVRTLEAALDLEKRSAVRFRLALDQIEILRRANQIDAARQKLADAIGTYKSADQQRAMGEIALAILPPPPPKGPKLPKP